MRSRTKSKGFTLLEMTMAVTITAIIGLAVAGATIALSRAYQDTEEFYQSLQTARSAMLRIQRTVQGSKLITACPGTILVLWVDDTNGNGNINADEVLVLVFDTAAQEVRLCRKVFPDALKPALNVEVPLYDLIDANAVLSNVSGSAYVQTIVLANDTTDFYATASPAPPLAKRVDLYLSVGTDKNVMALRSAATTRGPKTAQVQVVDSQYVLVPD